MAETAPEWLRRAAPPEGAERYRARFTSFRLPRAKAKREALTEVVGADGWHLLGLIYDGGSPPHLRSSPAIDTLRRVWLQQYVYERGEDGGGSSGGGGAGTNPRLR